MIKAIQFVLKSAFLKNMRHIVTGSLAAQVALLLAVPVLTSLFDPKAFGHFAAVVAASSILVTFSSLRLDILIPHARRQASVVSFLQACCVGPVVVSFLLLIVGLLISVFYTGNSSAFSQPTTLSVLVFIPLSAIGIAFMTSMRSLAVRLEKYRLIGGVQVLRVAILLLVTIALGLLGFTDYGIGLILGQLCGDLAFGFTIWIGCSARLKKRLFVLKISRIIQAIRLEAVAVKTLGFTQVIAILYDRSPPLVILAAFGPIEAGFYALAVRIAQAPVTLIAKAVDDVFRQRITRLIHKGDSIHFLMWRGLALTVGISVIPLVLAIFLSPKLVGPLFGVEWTDAVFTINVMLFISIFGFTSKAFDKVPIILEHYKFLSGWHLGRMAVELSAAIFAIYGLISYQEWLIFIGAGRSLMYLVKIVAGFFFAYQLRDSNSAL